MNRRRFVFLVSAPSGTGKTTIIRAVLERCPYLRKIVTTTSRLPRPGEIPGFDYHFVSHEQFLDMVKRREFIEWKEHFGHMYGLTWAEFQKSLSEDAIFDMDVFGKDEFLSEVGDNCVTIFLAPPSIEAIEERIKARGEYSEGELRERIGRAREELERADTYDYIVVNHQLVDTVEQIVKIVDGIRHGTRGGSKYICIEGLIGSGKTTLTQVLGASLAAKIYLDPYEDNPFLREFYFSKRSFALETELSFVLLRYRLMQRIEQDLSANRLVISDFTMWRSQLFASVNLQQEAYQLFDEVYKTLLKDVPDPDLLIWIEAPYDLLLRRIRARGRSEEILGVTETYLRELESRYKQMLRDKMSVEILSVTAESLDLVRSNTALSALMSRIAEPSS